MAKVHLDDNERGMLTAYQAADPKAEDWICPWALPDLSSLDAVAQTFHGSMAVARRLAGRKLLDAEKGVRGQERGYALNDKGRAALAQP